MKRIDLPFAAIAAVALLAAGCGDKDASQAKAAVKAEARKEAKGGEHKDEGLIKLSAEELSRAGLEVETLQPQRVAETLEVTATIGPNRERIANVLPRLGGRIVEVNVKLGDRVKQGQPLAVVESIEVGEAYSAYSQALAEAGVAKSAFERAERLKAEQIVPEKEYQRARGEYERSRAQLQSAANKLKQLGVSPPQEGKQASVSTFPVTAPLGGTVIERKAVLGELAKTDQSLFVIADLSKVWVEANVREADLGRVRPGATATARVSAFPERNFEAKVNYLGAVLDKETRTAQAIIELDNREGLLRPQMFAVVAIETGSAREVLALPESAVTLVQGVPTVFVKEAEGFEPRPVELSARAGGKAIVKSGLKPGELVVTEGTYALKARLLKSQIGDSH